MHSRKSIFKRGIVFILAIFAMAIFSQFKVGAACDVSIADGVDYLTLAGSNSRWSDSMLKVSDDCADAITKIDVLVNGKSAAGFVPQNYTEGQYTVEYRYTFQGETKSLYRYVRILNSSFDTSKNYTLGSFDVFEPGEDDKTDTQIVNAFYDSTNRHVINFIVSNKSTHVAITNLAGKELLRYEVAYRVGQTSYDLDLVDVLVNDNAYYLIGNTSQGGVLKRIDVSDLIVTESISVSSLNATSVYKGGYYISDSEIYLVGSDTSGYPIVDVYDGSISSYYKYETSKGVYNDMIVKFDYLYLDCYEKPLILKELTQLKLFLLECCNYGLLEYSPGWCMGYSNRETTIKAIKSAIKEMKEKIRKYPTWKNFKIGA
jgi:hypothetical protein